MLKKILKQYKTPGIGGFKEILAQTVFYITVINFILITVTAYNTTLREFFLVWMPGFKLWMFFVILIAGVLLGMILEYKFITPSQYAFKSKQLFEHESKVMDEIKKIHRLLDDINGKEKKDK